MRLITGREELRAWALDRGAPRPRVLVPTMGALHEGHLTLVDLARKRAGRSGEVAATIFVNPAQFAPHEDFDRYPRPLERDLALLEGRGCDLVFAPAREEMYAPDASVKVIETALSAGMEGASRPAFFAGVCTVVAKLFLLIQPDAAVFGEKDYQQLAVIRRMTRDLDFPVEILAAPTAREADGLAMSSRNAYLTPRERQQAAALPRALEAARRRLEQGQVHLPTLLDEVRQAIAAQPLARVDYVAGVDPDTLEPAGDSPGESLLLAVAAWFGQTRLIDNLRWRRNLTAEAPPAPALEA